MTYDEIMREITKGFTGDISADRQYLKEQMEKYKNHEMAKEILRGCGRLMVELIPEDKKEELARLIGNGEKAIEATLDEIRYNIYKQDLETAMKLSEALVEKIDKNPMFQNDTVSEYFTFYEFFEELLYAFYQKPEKTIRKASIPFATIYLQHGSLLVEQKRYLRKSQKMESSKCKNSI